MRAHRLIAAVGLIALGTAGAAQAPPNIDELMTRVGERIADYYRRAQNVICTERATVQAIGTNFSPQGFARTVESELRVESDALDGEGAAEPRVVREIRKVNGRPPRERDRKDRSGCTDPNPLSTEPLAFLLPKNRGDYEFSAGGFGKEKNRAAVLIDFASVNRKSKPELIEDEHGHEDCFDWSGPIAVKGRVWVDAQTYEVLRVDRRIGGPIDVRVPSRLQRRYNFSTWVILERDDLSIKYKTVDFHEPDETMLLPESIEALIVVHGGLESSRRTQVFTDYRRFLTAGRIIK